MAGSPEGWPFTLAPRPGTVNLTIPRQELTIVDEAFREGRLSWSKTRLLARICARETQDAWLERASQRSVRALEREVAGAQVGQAPRDDEHGLPEPRVRISTTVDTLTYGLWELAKQKLEDEIGERIEDGDVLRVLCETILSSSADGTIPGRRRVDDSLYHVVIEDPGAEGVTALRTADGSIEVDAATEEMLRCDASCSCGGNAHENGHSRSSKSSAAVTRGMRKRVLARDGHCCRSCGSRRYLMIHPIRWLSRGGVTRMVNLISAYSRCHAMIHAGKLVIEGEDARIVRFLDAHGRERAARGEAASIRIVRRETSVPDARTMLQEMPETLTPEWWREHAHLFEFEGGRMRLAAPIQ